VSTPVIVCELGESRAAGDAAADESARHKMKG
jgi:hypothetical protein